MSSVLNKVCVCLCCSECACTAACCIDQWHSVQACGLAYLECGSCCWTVFAPVCHSCSIGDFGQGIKHCISGIKYCVYSCGLSCCAPVDGCYNCVMYDLAICKESVSGFGDILKNVDFIGKKIRDAMDFPESPQPITKFGEYRP